MLQIEMDAKDIASIVTFNNFINDLHYLSVLLKSSSLMVLFAIILFNLAESLISKVEWTGYFASRTGNKWGTFDGDWTKEPKLLSVGRPGVNIKWAGKLECFTKCVQYFILL